MKKVGSSNRVSRTRKEKPTPRRGTEEPIASSIKYISFRNVSEVSSALKRLKIKPAQARDAVAAVLSASPRKGRMVAKGLIRNSPTFAALNEIITSVRMAKAPSVRKEVVRAFKESKRHMEFITGLSLMTKRDATVFLGDYFEAGGRLSDVGAWLANMSAVYVEKKRNGEIDPDHDGFWSDQWDGIADAGKAIGEAITTVVEAVIAAGVAFADIVDEIIDSSQARFNMIVEALLDAGRDVGELVAGVIQAAGNEVTERIRKLCKAVIAAGRTIGELLQALYDHAAEWVRDGVETALRIGVRIKDLLAESMALGLDKLSEITGILLGLGHSAWYIVRWTLKQGAEIIETVFAKLLDMGKTVADLVVYCARRSFEVVLKGFGVLLQLGKTIEIIAAALITACDGGYAKGLKALMELGGTMCEFFATAHDIGKAFIKRVYLALTQLGMSLSDILKKIAEKGFEAFKPIVLWLIDAGVKVGQDLIFALGYEYDSEQGIFYSRIDPWQKNFGFFTLYDQAAPLVGMNLHCEPIHFEYAGKGWKIEFWKGEYGIFAGAEIGIYTGEFEAHTGIEAIDHTINKFDFGDDTNCAGDADMLQMSFSLKKGNEVLFTRQTDKHWWLTGFKPMVFATPSDLKMDIKIVLKDEDMCGSFSRALRNAGYSESECIPDGKALSIVFDVPHMEQPW